MRSAGCSEWSTPPGLIVAELDRVTGQMADSTTPPYRRYTEYFLAGTEPLPLRVNGWNMFKYGPITF